MSNLSSIVVPFTNNEVFINLVEKRIIVNNKLLAMSQGYYLSKWRNGKPVKGFTIETFFDK